MTETMTIDPMLCLPCAHEGERVHAIVRVTLTCAIHDTAVCAEHASLYIRRQLKLTCAECQK